MKLHPLNVDFAWKPTNGPFRWISDEQARFYDEYGYLLLERALSPQEVNDLVDEVERFEARFSAERSPHDILYADSEHTSSVLQLAPRSERIRKLCFSPLFLGVVADLVGPNAWMHYDHSIFKKPYGKIPFFWHQDNAFACVEPQQKCVTFWVALTDMKDEDGCLWVQPGGHLAGTLAHRNNEDGWICYDEHPDSALVLPVSAGDIVVHSSLLPHFSKPNRTHRERKAYSFTYVPSGAYTFQVIDGQRTRVPCDNGLQVLRDGSPASSAT